MLILSMFFMATSKIITVKQKDEARVKTTGYYECYINDDKMYEKYHNTNTNEVDSCVFNQHYTRPNVIFYSINSQHLCSDVALEISNPLTIHSAELNDSGFSYMQEDLDSEDKCQSTVENINTFIEFVSELYPTSSISTFTPQDYNSKPVVFIAW